MRIELIMLVDADDPYEPPFMKTYDSVNPEERQYFDQIVVDNDEYQRYLENVRKHF